MSKLFGKKDPNTNLRKNVFDLSEKSLYSLSAGMLLPCMVKELNPGEKVQLSLNGFTRTQPMNTAAFVRMRQYYHYFFVPNKQLWSGWDNFIHGVDYKTSSLQKKMFNNKQYSKVPSVKLFKSIVDLFKEGYFRTKIQIDVSDPTEMGLKSLDEMGYYNIDGASRLLDMLGYGFSLSSFRGNGRDAFTLREVYEKILNIDEKGKPFGNDPALGSVGGEGIIEFYNKVALKSLEKVDFHINPFRLLAYQKIYSDFYKNDDYEATNPYAFNIDDFDGSTPITDIQRVREMLKIRYRWMPKDYFTGVVPSELAGLNNALTGMVAVGNTNNSLGVTLDREHNGVVVVDNNWGNNTRSVTTKTIRSAFAVEKLLRNTRRARGFDYASQVEAHYGFDVPKGRGTDVEFLGGFSSQINISEVLTQADTDRGFTGQVYGKGVGVSNDNKPIEYQAKEHGILMCITSVVPELDYSCVGLENFNAKFYRGDYFQPEFQDLGLQPLFGFEYLNFWTNTADVNSPVRDDLRHKAASTILGFLPRYAEYKTSYDRLHGEFRNGRSLAAWSANSTLGYVGGVVPHTLKINPKCLDRLFAVAYDGSEKTDQFMVQTQFVTKIIRPMSVHGQGF